MQKKNGNILQIILKGFVILHRNSAPSYRFDNHRQNILEQVHLNVPALNEIGEHCPWFKKDAKVQGFCRKKYVTIIMQVKSNSKCLSVDKWS